MIGLLVVLWNPSFQAQTSSAQSGSAVTSMLAEFEHAKQTFPNFRTESAAEFEKIKNYREELFNEGVVTNAFETADGKLIHCIEIGSQRSVKNAGLTPGEIRTGPAIPPLTDQTPGHEKAANPADFGLDGTRDAQGNLRRCPPGSIPVLIPTLEDLCRFRTFDDIFRKYPIGTNVSSATTLASTNLTALPPGPVDLLSPDAVVHEYAHAYTSVENQGEQATFNVWQPSVERNDEFSLSQLWVARASGSSSNLQTAETGWQVYSNLYNDSRPHLFIYSTTHNYDSGYTGGYNLGPGMFVQVDSSVVIGGAFSPVSTQGGTQYVVRLMFYRDPGGSHDWWLKYEDKWVGYYPNSYYNSNGIADKSASIDFGGEIVNTNIGATHTTTDMGSGRFPSEGFGYSAYIKDVTYVDLNYATREAGSLNKDVTNANYYDLSLLFSSDSSWRNYFYFGGPGRVIVSAVGHDLNSDGKPDLVWQNASTGQGYMWFMNGQGDEQTGRYVGNGGNYGNWKIVAVADLNSDGRADLIWQDASTGQGYIWFMNGQGDEQSGRYVGNGGNYGNWKIVGAADLNSDGKADLIWQDASTGQGYIWFMNGQGEEQSGRYVGSGGNYGSWKIVAAVDLNNDGRADVVWQDAATGQGYIWFMNGQGDQQSGRYVGNGGNYGDWKIRP